VEGIHQVWPEKFIRELLIIMGKTIFITGATSGIGRACAMRFAHDNNTLIITGRREERLKELSDQLKETFNGKIVPLVFDIRNQDEVVAAVDSLPPDIKAPDVLINNAGLALGLETIDKGNTQQWDTMIDTNVKGLLYITKALVPGMIERKTGHIINIGSIAGRETYLNGNVYCASKAAVDSLSKAMRIDLLPHGIKVTQIAPGAVETEFSNVRFSGDNERAKAVYKGFEPLHPEDVADVVHYAATLPPHVNINDLLLMPAAQASAGLIQRNL
jgi:NADP-dependent 3-hydroxy acid dehydrogenase YdfG